MTATFGNRVDHKLSDLTGQLLQLCEIKCPDILRTVDPLEKTKGAFFVSVFLSHCRVYDLLSTMYRAIAFSGVARPPKTVRKETASAIRSLALSREA